MQKLESTQHLVNEVLDVLSEELLLRANDSAQISFHQLADQVDVSQNLSVIAKKNSENRLVMTGLVARKKLLLHLPLFRNVDDI